jgi:hypothetical protein
MFKSVEVQVNNHLRVIHASLNVTLDRKLAAVDGVLEILTGFDIRSLFSKT